MHVYVCIRMYVCMYVHVGGQVASYKQACTSRYSFPDMCLYGMGEVTVVWVNSISH